MKFHLLMSSAMLFAMAGSAMAAKVTVTGNVTDVFGHRYVVDEGGKKSLVDIGPKGRDAVTINSGDKVSVEGELTDAGEVRAASVAVGDKPAVELPEARTWWEKLTGAEPKDKVDLTPDAAKVMVQKAGYEVIGEPRPKKKHFEVLGKKDGKFYEVHAHADGDLKGIHTVDASDPKWGSLVK
jgi:hypothetical protein